MSAGEQRTAIALLLAAAELLRDPLASDAERARIAGQIDRFVNHEPVDVAGKSPAEIFKGAGKERIG